MSGLGTELELMQRRMIESIEQAISQKNAMLAWNRDCIREAERLMIEKMDEIGSKLKPGNVTNNPSKV